MNPMTAGLRSELAAAISQAQVAKAAAPARDDNAPVVVAFRPPRRPRRAVGKHPRTGAKPFALRLWLPLTPLWILLAPFALLLAPLLTLSAATRGVPPYRAAFAIGAMLLNLGGTVVDVKTPDALIHIRIF